MRKGEFAMRAQNLTLLTDLYELTMMQGYYENPSDQIVVFDAFYRKNPCGGAYAVCAGLEQVIEYVRDLHFSPDDIDYLRSLHIFNDDFLEYLRGFHFTGDIYAIPEGTVVFPREPLLKVVAPIMEAQLVETAHSWIMSFPDEYTAFKTYAKMYPEACILLVDTYDVLESGVPNAIRVFKEMRAEGLPMKGYGIRIDSGDLAYLSKKAYQMLEAEGFGDAIISASSDLDEYLIDSLKTQGAKINSWGVGTNLITSGDWPAFGGVYKLAAAKDKEDAEFTPKIKLSENSEKVTNPGNKTIFRIYDKESGKIRADLICLADETFDESKDMIIFDPIETWKKTKIKGGTYTLRELLVPIFQKGACVYTSPSVMEIRDICTREKDTLWEESKRLVNPHEVYVDLSDKLYHIKSDLLEEMSMKALGEQ